MSSSLARAAVALGLISLAGCDSGRPAASPGADPCHPQPPVRCEADRECTPYLCKTTFCGQKCESSAVCAQGYVCSPSGACVKAGTCGTCSGDYDCTPGQKCDPLSWTCR